MLYINYSKLSSAANGVGNDSIIFSGCISL